MLPPETVGLDSVAVLRSLCSGAEKALVFPPILMTPDPPFPQPWTMEADDLAPHTDLKSELHVICYLSNLYYAGFNHCQHLMTQHHIC